MSIRSPAATPSSRTWRCTALCCGSNSAATNCSCRSRSAGMMKILESIRLPGFGDEHVQRGNVEVPLDQRGYRPEAFQRRRVQRPHFFAHRRVVRVDADVPIPDPPYAVTCEMDLANALARNPIEVSVWIEPMIH